MSPSYLPFPQAPGHSKPSAPLRLWKDLALNQTHEVRKVYSSKQNFS